MLSRETFFFNPSLVESLEYKYFVLPLAQPLSQGRFNKLSFGEHPISPETRWNPAWKRSAIEDIMRRYHTILGCVLLPLTQRVDVLNPGFFSFAFDFVPDIFDYFRNSEALPQSSNRQSKMFDSNLHLSRTSFFVWTRAFRNRLLLYDDRIFSCRKPLVTRLSRGHIMCLVDSSRVIGLYLYE